MAWKIEIAAEATKDIASLDRTAAQRIIRFLRERVASSGNPRTLGTALQGSRFEKLYRFRTGDYRIIASIDDAVVTVLVLRIGHRREIYR